MKPRTVGQTLVLFLAIVASLSSPACDGPESGGGSATNADPEPTTGAPTTPNPGSETAMKDPFKPYDTGPDPWSYEQLENDDLRAQVDRGRDVTGWDAIHNAYGQASHEAAQVTQAAAALHQLGIQDTDNLLDSDSRGER